MFVSSTSMDITYVHRFCCGVCLRSPSKAQWSYRFRRRALESGREGENLKDSEFYKDLYDFDLYETR